MKTQGKTLLTLLMGGIFAFATLGEIPLAKANPPPWAPAHGYRAKQAKRYYYYYYPAQQVYYSPVRNGYYYLNGSNWVFGPTVPAAIQLGNKVRIELGTPIPYSQHTYVIQQYPVIVR
jgi:hypothetical protein